MNDIVTRPYASGDFNACMAIFDSNVPTFFAMEERAEFSEFLRVTNTTENPYLVFTLKGSVIACGGLTIQIERRQASLSWGMVERAFHRKGLGTRLTQDRLTLARRFPSVDTVALSTTQYSSGFYSQLGFIVAKVTPDGFGAGLDRLDMSLRIA